MAWRIEATVVAASQHDGAKHFPAHRAACHDGGHNRRRPHLAAHNPPEAAGLSSAKLDITPLANAIERLREGLVRHHQEPDDDQLRDGLIQRFEYTYELGHRMLRRFIRLTSASPEEVDRMAFQDLIRTANQQNLLLGDWPAWHRWRDMRARTSHTYRAETAREVASSIPGFLAEVDFLRAALASRLR